MRFIYKINTHGEIMDEATLKSRSKKIEKRLRDSRFLKETDVIAFIPSNHEGISYITEDLVHAN